MDDVCAKDISIAHHHFVPASVVRDFTTQNFVKVEISVITKAKFSRKPPAQDDRLSELPAIGLALYNPIVVSESPHVLVEIWAEHRVLRVQRLVLEEADGVLVCSVSM